MSFTPPPSNSFDAPPLPELPSLPKTFGSSWPCSKCGNKNPPTVSRCQCGYLMLELVPAPNPPAAVLPKPENFVPVANSNVWTCPNPGCKYEYNMKEHGVCQKCGNPKPQVQTQTAPAVVNDLVWTCVNPGCKYEYNMKEHGVCQKCGNTKPQAQVQAPNPLYASQGSVQGYQYQPQNSGFGESAGQMGQNPAQTTYPAAYAPTGPAANFSSAQTYPSQPPNASYNAPANQAYQTPQMQSGTVHPSAQRMSQTHQSSPQSQVFMHTAPVPSQPVYEAPRAPPESQLVDVTGQVTLSREGWKCENCQSIRPIYYNYCENCKQLSSIGQVLMQHYQALFGDRQ